MLPKGKERVQITLPIGWRKKMRALDWEHETRAIAEIVQMYCNDDERLFTSAASAMLAKEYFVQGAKVGLEIGESQLKDVQGIYASAFADIQKHYKSTLADIEKHIEKHIDTLCVAAKELAIENHALKDELARLKEHCSGCLPK
jgi:hypothetical protein